MNELKIGDRVKIKNIYNPTAYLPNDDGSTTWLEHNLVPEGTIAEIITFNFDEFQSIMKGVCESFGFDYSNPVGLITKSLFNGKLFYVPKHYLEPNE